MTDQIRSMCGGRSLASSKEEGKNGREDRDPPCTGLLATNEMMN